MISRTLVNVRLLATTPVRAAAIAAAKNLIFAPIRDHDSFTHLSLSSSARQPLLTLWTAAWCPSCRVVEPLLTDLVAAGVGESLGAVYFAPVHFDTPDLLPADANSLALTYMISSVPTLLSFDASEPQIATKVTDARRLAGLHFLEDWICTEAKRRGSRGGGGGDRGGGLSAAFGGLFGRKQKLVMFSKACGI